MNQMLNRRIVSCFLTVAFATIYLWRPIQSITIGLSTISVFCIALLALNLAQGFTEKNNVQKVLSFVASTMISVIGAALNMREDTTNAAFSLRLLSSWSWFWLVLFAVSAVSLAVTLIRVLRWDQKQWEEYRQWRQDYRKESLEARRARTREKQANRLDRLKDKGSAALKEQKERLENNAAIHKAKHAEHLKRINEGKTIGAWIAKNTQNLLAFWAVITIVGIFLLLLLFFPNGAFIDWLTGYMPVQIEFSQSPISRLFRLLFIIGSIVLLLVWLCKSVFRVITGEKPQKPISWIATIVVSVIATLFFIIPNDSILTETITNWIKNASELAKQLNFIKFKETSDNFLYAFLQYLLFFVLLIFIAWLLAYLAYVIYETLSSVFGKKEDGNSNQKGGKLLTIYAMPFAVLIVTFTAMLALGGEDITFAESVWSRLFSCIVFLLVIFVSIGLVKHILKQMGTEDSLLQLFIRLLFIATMALFSDMVFGVIIAMGIALDTANLTTSNSIISEVRDKFHIILRNEIKKIAKRHRPAAFSKKNIWRRK